MGVVEPLPPPDTGKLSGNFDQMELNHPGKRYDERLRDPGGLMLTTISRWSSFSGEDYADLAYHQSQPDPRYYSVTDGSKLAPGLSSPQFYTWPNEALSLSSLPAEQAHPLQEAGQARLSLKASMQAVQHSYSSRQYRMHDVSGQPHSYSREGGDSQHCTPFLFGTRAYTQQQVEDEARRRQSNRSKFCRCQQVPPYIGHRARSNQPCPRLHKTSWDRELTRGGSINAVRPQMGDHCPVIR
jgi:hypothetical protein